MEKFKGEQKKEKRTTHQVVLFGALNSKFEFHVFEQMNYSHNEIISFTGYLAGNTSPVGFFLI